MKTLFLALIAFVTLSFTSTNTKTANVIFDGYDGEGYSFSTLTDENNEDTIALYFTTVDKKIIKEFNLESEETVGTEFTISYSVTTETTESDEGEEETQDIYTLLSLKKK